MFARSQLRPALKWLVVIPESDFADKPLKIRVEKIEMNLRQILIGAQVFFSSCKSHSIVNNAIKNVYNSKQHKFPRIRKRLPYVNQHNYIKHKSNVQTTFHNSGLLSLTRVLRPILYIPHPDKSHHETSKDLRYALWKKWHFSSFTFRSKEGPNSFVTSPTNA